LVRQEVSLDGNSLNIEQVVRIARQFDKVEISPSALSNVKEGRKSVERILRSSKTVYGLNTGFGKLADVRIESGQLDALQLNLIRSHSVGTGPNLTEEEARAMMVARLNSLLRGNSGIRPEVAKQLQKFLNARIHPEIPSYGSLGASGDLAPSAHLALCLVGEGFALSEGKRVSARTMLRRRKIAPIKLKAKEGLAIINGTQLMTGLGCLLANDCESMFYNLDVAAALTIEALRGSSTPYESRVHELRPHHGQAHVASRILRLVRGSSLIGTSSRVQDPYSIRCIPQVHGAYHDSLQYLRRVLEVELNSVTDNPLVYPDTDDVVSSGNFHGQPISMALDLLGIAMSSASVISERRINKLLSSFNPELPLFLAKESGLNSGLMMLQYTAASLVAENRILARPSSVDSADVSASQEDHASMGVTSALKARHIWENTNRVIAIELMCGAQAIDLIKDAKCGQGTTLAHSWVRKLSNTVSEDRPLSDELRLISSALRKDELRKAIEEASVQL
jgi:histidine ammonia-lyase